MMRELFRTGGAGREEANGLGDDAGHWPVQPMALPHSGSEGEKCACIDKGIQETQ
jgi:hypothetical protein